MARQPYAVKQQVMQTIAVNIAREFPGATNGIYHILSHLFAGMPDFIGFLEEWCPGPSSQTSHK